MKTIELNDEQIAVIKMSLQYLADKKIDLISQNRNLLTDAEEIEIYKTYKKYCEVLNSFKNQLKKI